MTSVSPVSATTPVAALSSVTSPNAVRGPTAAAAVGSGPAAIVQLSDRAKAILKGDKDWTPGTPIDNI